MPLHILLDLSTTVVKRSTPLLLRHRFWSVVPATAASANIFSVMHLRRSQKRGLSVAVEGSGDEDTTTTEPSPGVTPMMAPAKKKKTRIATASSSKSVSIPILPEDGQTSRTQILFTYDQLVPGRLLRRYKRFLADVELVDAERVPSGKAGDAVPVDDAKVVTVYCPNTGPMVGLLDLPNARVQLSKSDDLKRKYQYTLEMIQVDVRGCYSLGGHGGGGGG